MKISRIWSVLRLSAPKISPRPVHNFRTYPVTFPYRTNRPSPSSHYLTLRWQDQTDLPTSWHIKML